MSASIAEISRAPISPPANSPHSFKRAYQACIHCRRRKVRCILDDSDPRGLQFACIRCKRERRQCAFAERRSHSTAVGNTNDSARDIRSPDDRNLQQQIDQNEISSQEAIPAASTGNHAIGIATPRMDDCGAERSGQSEHNTTHTTPSSDAADTGIHSQSRRRQPDFGNSAVHRVVTSPEDTLPSPLQDTDHQDYIDGGRPPLQNGAHNFAQSMASNNSQIPTTSSPGYPALERVTEEWSSLRYPLSNPSQTTLESWKSCLFVKLGWFTTAEAVTYVDLFFQNMNTLSPILNDYYHAHSNHHTLVLKDPVLCCTIITLSSRYHLLAGEGGLTRGFQIHYRMWKHCQSLFHRVVWGQRGTTKDQVGALGTIESFLLVTEQAGLR
ncbi:hypothetical protein L207DRAFT_562870 [Hyaloscypha variabilis F]|uniref:Zn(2)-C6 fungal-type domain-containing protein n=1 Tax=Hyaloscypha variabilis (strain UAMH 11265 / GT02V1 / F) TaxID=1149755 RepID=A0A2J6S4T7_HYAVF|nr:hypothetical protein L207DRAFT_562870 [Hyaloscypha variabilis F]